MDFPSPRMVQTNGIRMAVHEAGQGPAVVFCHGFPELAFSWRHQLHELGGAGYRCIAPDMRGYGGTDRPAPVEAYDMPHLTGDLVGLLDALGLERAVFCGHDWGGAVVWEMALRHPARVAGVVALNTPWRPRGERPTLEILRELRGPDTYILAFQEPNKPDALLAEHRVRLFDRLMRRPAYTLEEFFRLPARVRNLTLSSMVEPQPRQGEPLLTKEEMQVYLDAFGRTGFTGAINWYRNMNRNWELAANLPQRIEVPALMISAAQDVYLPPMLTDGMEQYVPRLEKALIPQCGHWTQQERPQETNRLILDWLRRHAS
ncbi:MAG TPA: alpha/beta hydrolase [bacterium]|nr:alpha/beta hydrolase [bacterium]